MITKVSEDYIKTIYNLQQKLGENERVRTKDLAEARNVTAASVTGSLKNFSAVHPELVDYQKYKGVRLTRAGEEVALSLIRNHRLIESYLVEVLGYSWDEVHQEADLLEHVVSTKLVDRIDEVLGSPIVDPHGGFIPNKKGEVTQFETTSLTLAEIGEPMKISHVEDGEPELLQFLKHLGLTPGTTVEVVQKDPFDGPLHLCVLPSRSLIPVGRKVTDQVFITTR
jgi:DtxR family Mn-dependent transcriptional regulator